MVNLRFDWVVTSAKMHLNLIVRFFFFQLARFTSYRNAPFQRNNLGTSCPKVDYFSISFFLSGLPSSGGCLAFQSSSRDMI